MSKKTGKKFLGFLSIPLVTLILLAGCGGGENTNNGQNSGDEMSSQQENTEQNSGEESKEKNVDSNKQDMKKEQSKEVEMDDFYFEPKKITLQQGEKATLELHNEGDKEHTFTVEELGVDAELEAGKTKKVTITGKKPGTYKLVCEYHKDQGMTGTIVVK